MSCSERRELQRRDRLPKLHSQHSLAIVNGGAADKWHADCAGLQTAGKGRTGVVITHSFEIDIFAAPDRPKRLRASPQSPLLLSYSLLYASFW
jgi:hypothetical protein